MISLCFPLSLSLSLPLSLSLSLSSVYIENEVNRVGVRLDVESMQWLNDGHPGGRRGRRRDARPPDVSLSRFTSLSV